eukprot:403375749
MNSNITVEIRYQKCPSHSDYNLLYLDTNYGSTYCDQCISANKTNVLDFKNLNEHCKEQYEQWKKLNNQARYLSSEHDQKEKEYGIAWRSAFKIEINKALLQLRMKLFGIDKIEDGEDVFSALNLIVSNSKQDAESFYLNTQLNMLNTIQESYKLMERQVTYLKKLLKEPDTAKFEHIKKEIFV